MKRIMTTKLAGPERRRLRIRKKVKGTSGRPRLSVFRSNRHIYAQIIDDTTGKTLASASTTGAGFGSGDEKKVGHAMKVGEAIGKVAIEKGIKKVVFDRSGHIYHGRIKALADGARKSGLAF